MVWGASVSEPRVQCVIRTSPISLEERILRPHVSISLILVAGLSPIKSGHIYPYARLLYLCAIFQVTWAVGEKQQATAAGFLLFWNSMGNCYFSDQWKGVCLWVLWLLPQGARSKLVVRLVHYDSCKAGNPEWKKWKEKSLCFKFLRSTDRRLVIQDQNIVSQPIRTSLYRASSWTFR